MKKIAACLIVKDDTEEEILERCLSTVAPHVQGIFITGTKKPQKRIKKVCKKYGAVWSWFEWNNNFSDARNFNFAQAKDFDWIFWCDTDDILIGGQTFERAIQLAEQNNVSAVFTRYLYQVEADEKGNIKEVLIEHLRERLIKNDGSYKWIAPIHETLIKQRPVGETDFTGFYVVHLSDISRFGDAMYRNIEILQEEVMNNPTDPRPIYYLAKAYFDTREDEILYKPLGNGMDSLTIELLKDYLRKSGWEEERAQAWEYLSMIHRERQEYKKAIQCLLESFAETPKFPSTYIQLALNYVMMKRWDLALHWVNLASRIDMPNTTLVTNPRDYKAMILECLYHIYINTGKLEETEKVASALVKLLPSDLNRQRELDIKDMRHRNNLAHWTVKLAQHLKNTNQVAELRALIGSIPREIANEPVLISLRNEISPPRVWGNREIALWCGPGWEKWSPKNASKGIGGSEEAVIYLSKELTKLGWEVTVYADPQDEEGTYEGVKYLPHYTINWQDQFNILISWRQIGMFDIPFNARKTYLWNHDIQNPLDYTEERIRRVDKVFFLSRWHRQNVPALPEEKVMYTANGLNI